ncbi:hypothetical protein [Actinomycetospora straminea]|uniref:Excreted virulence factor EspC (Type VII ESX diderm) n=1 Tax=Actinomycetospora straminea TaxID=663607 RepID=A0ABP9FAU0_9PSEU|nr:hypothetical protein [Actinomycetospora straminea]MDD7936616.1 hypothetical protein [Actinomycetospora straminea]
MPDLDVDTRALEEARTVVAGESGRMPGLADPLGPTPPDVGGLAASAALRDAVAALTRALTADLEAAGARLGDADRALDATIQLMQETDQAAAVSLSPAGS